MISFYVFFFTLSLGDLLNNYCWSDDLMNVSRLIFSSTVLLTYPIECFVCREVVTNLIYGQEEMEDSFKTHFLITFVIVAAAYGSSLVTNCLGTVLEINVSVIRPHLIRNG